MTAIKALCCVSLIGMLIVGCASNVEVQVRVYTPCSESTQLLSDIGCTAVTITVSSTDPSDPLNVNNVSTGGGPKSKICDLNAEDCDISSELFLGSGRRLDVTCSKAPDDTTALARATSQPMTIDSSVKGHNGQTINLLIGRLNTFVATTVIDPNDSNFNSCSQLRHYRYAHAATLLNDGLVFMTGGIDSATNTLLDSVEIFNPTTGSHQLAVGTDEKALSVSVRAYHTATTLKDGRVLITGGVGLQDGKKTSLSEVLLYNPVSKEMVLAPPLGSSRAHHTATLLTDGRVIIAGGASYSNDQIESYLNSTEIYTPQQDGTGEWTVGGSLTKSRAFHQATLTNPDSSFERVVLFGGENKDDGTLNSVDIFNPHSNDCLPSVIAGNITMNKRRSHHCAVALNNGLVMIVGGKIPNPNVTSLEQVDDTAEIFDPLDGAYGRFRNNDIKLNVARMDHTCSLLESGNILVAGGATTTDAPITDVQATNVTEVIVVGTNTYTIQQTDGLLDPSRSLHSATVLLNGWVLIEGGLAPQGSIAFISQGQLFVPPPSF
jgi:hypothetical protein